MQFLGSQQGSWTVSKERFESTKYNRRFGDVGGGTCSFGSEKGGSDSDRWFTHVWVLVFRIHDPVLLEVGMESTKSGLGHICVGNMMNNSAALGLQYRVQHGPTQRIQHANSQTNT